MKQVPIFCQCYDENLDDNGNFLDQLMSKFNLNITLKSVYNSKRAYQQTGKIRYQKLKFKLVKYLMETSYKRYISIEKNNLQRFLLVLILKKTRYEPYCMKAEANEFLDLKEHRKQ